MSVDLCYFNCILHDLLKQWMAFQTGCSRKAAPTFFHPGLLPCSSSGFYFVCFSPDHLAHIYLLLFLCNILIDLCVPLYLLADNPLKQSFETNPLKQSLWNCVTHFALFFFYFFGLRLFIAWLLVYSILGFSPSFTEI